MAGIFPDNPAHAITETAEEPMPAAAPRLWQLVYFLLTVTFTFMLLSTLFPRIEIRLPLTLIVLALLLLSLKRWTGVLFLLVLQLHAFSSERPLPPSVTSVSFVWGLIGVGLVLVVSRYRTLQERDGQSVFHSLGALVSAVRTPSVPEVQLLTENLRQIAWQLLKAALMIVVCGVAAAWLLSSVPLQMSSIREVGLQPAGHRLIILSLKLFIIALVSWIAINEIAWRSLSRSQAGIYVRSTFLNWIHRDLRMVVARRIKAGRRRTRTTAATVKPSDSKSEDGQTLE